MKTVQHTILFFCIMCCTTACTFKINDNVTPPSNIIPKDTFSLVVHDMMVLDAYYKSLDLKITTVYRSVGPAVDSIFSKYNIDSTRFASSMGYYSKQQDELKEVYQSIQDHLILNTAKYQKK